MCVCVGGGGGGGGGGRLGEKGGSEKLLNFVYVCGGVRVWMLGSWGGGGGEGEIE